MVAPSGVVDVASMFAAVADAGLDPSVLDASIRMPKAKSVIDWALSEQFLNIQLWSRQAEQAVRLWADYCPNCTDLGYLNNVPVGDSIVEFQKRVIVLEEGICPRCAGNRKKLFSDWWEAEGVKEYPDYASTLYLPPNELASCQGQRSGKSTTVGSLHTTYRVHQHLNLTNPYSYHSCLASTPFQGAFVSVSKEQALKNLWPFFHGSVATAPWFINYANSMRKEEKKHGLKKETLFKLRGTFVYFGAKALIVDVGAANENTLRGATRVFVAMDEIGFFRQGEDVKMAAADQVYIALSNSLKTLRLNAEKRWNEGDFNAPTGMMFNISSPKHKYDKMMQLLRESKKSPRMCGFHLATWEMNPNAPRASFVDEEIRDPKEFMRNYGAIPPLASDPYHGNFEAIEKCQKVMPSVVDIQTVYATVADEKLVAGAVKSAKDEKTIGRILACDAGHSNNGFAISMSHVDNIGGEYKFVVDAVFTAIPEKNPDVRVSFPMMADLILELVRRFRIRHVMYDRWQSTGEIQRLQRSGVPALAYSPVWADFEALKGVINSQGMVLPSWEKRVDELDLDDVHDLRLNPYTHLGYQIATVQDSGGKKVGKPAKGDDDMYRTLVLAYSKFRTDLAGYAVTGFGGVGGAQQQQNPGSIGVMVTRGGQRRSMSLSGVGGGRGIPGTVKKRTSR